jgi:hypothetical protein
VYCVCVGLDFVLVLIVQFVLLEQRLVVDGDVSEDWFFREGRKMINNTDF